MQLASGDNKHGVISLQLQKDNELISGTELKNKHNYMPITEEIGIGIAFWILFGIISVCILSVFIGLKKVRKARIRR